ncbi:MAG: hypothetical protein IH944_00300 [Armatimonadetes bacterium]|nr:hypothetical protein [Armatimonadota bacterium]
MNSELYKRLVDMYADRELTEELIQEMEAYAETDDELKQDMISLRATVDILSEMHDDVEVSEETYQRILLKLRTAGVQIETAAPEPQYWQYQLPMQG